MINKLLPLYIKVEISKLKNTLLDIVNGNYFKYARTINKGLLYKDDIEITQEIKQSETSSAKLLNFEIAIKKIEEIQININ
tara:strand:- start:82 stop:324 length:243 start_codon:yes stop_codon:yes gene_type:complete